MFAGDVGEVHWWGEVVRGVVWDVEEAAADWMGLGLEMKQLFTGEGGILTGNKVIPFTHGGVEGFGGAVVGGISFVVEEDFLFH